MPYTGKQGELPLWRVNIANVKRSGNFLPTAVGIQVVLLERLSLKLPTDHQSRY